MATFRVLAVSLLLAASQMAAAENPAGPQPGAAPYAPPAGFGYGPRPFGGVPYGGAPYAGPYAGVPYGAGPFGGGPFRGGPFNGGRYGGGPLSGVPFMQSFDMSRPDSFNPMRREVWGRGPQAWMNPMDPKEGLADAWDDMMNAPHRMGRVPPGWKAPSIDIPNPIDVGDEFEKNARRAPTIIRDNFSFN